jgi:hypothetical protein
MQADPSVAIRTLSDVLAMLEIYKKHIFDCVRDALEDPNRSREEKAALNLHYGRLCEEDGLTILVLIWNASRLITDEDLFRADLSRMSDPTRTSLGNVLRATDRRPVRYGSPDKFVRRAARIVDAGMAFGLLEQVVVKPGRKRLRATKKLHDLLTRVGNSAAVVLNATCIGV